MQSEASHFLKTSNSNSGFSLLASYNPSKAAKNLFGLFSHQVNVINILLANSQVCAVIKKSNIDTIKNDHFYLILSKKNMKRAKHVMKLIDLSKCWI